jgi:N4-gp56 family major capsid protein
MANEITYGTGSNSSVGSQIRTDYYYKAALVEAAKDAYFSQLADVRAMPANSGKTIKQYHYLPILDDRNLNSQGIDAAGAVAAGSMAPQIAYIKVVGPDAEGTAGAGMEYYFRGTHASVAATALANAKLKATAWLLSLGFNTTNDTYAELSVTGAGSAYDGGYRFTEIPATGLTPYGNLYGSSKDIGAIQGKIPALSETGGRVNRVGMTRIELESTLEKFGFFTEYTKDSMQFDTDDQLMMHLTKEVVKAANEITEDQLQIDLLNGAGVIRYTGAATSTATLQGNDTAAPFASDNTNDALSYDDLVKLSIELDNNRCPKNTMLIAGSRMVDTKVVNAARYIYIGSELLPTVMRLTDYHGNKAFIPVAQYANAGTVARGEVGAIDNFRFIVVPEMMHWEAAGATVSDPDGGVAYRFSSDGTNFRFNVYPMLVVGEGSFTTIGFQTDGKSVKFMTKHVTPEQNYTTENPFGEVGFHSIKWWYSTMILRPERLACIRTIAEW